MSRAFLALLVLDALILYLEDSQKRQMETLRRAQAAIRAISPGAFGLDPSG